MIIIITTAAAMKLRLMMNNSSASIFDVEDFVRGSKIAEVLGEEGGEGEDSGGLRLTTLSFGGTGDDPFFIRDSTSVFLTLRGGLSPLA